MKQRERTRKVGKAGEALLALTPLLAVAAAIVFLAFAGRIGSDPAGKSGAAVMAQAKPGADKAGDDSSAASEEAAAAAIVAISLARVAPPLPEEALQPRKPAVPPAGAAGPETTRGAPGEGARKATPRREAPGAVQTAGQTAGQTSGQTAGQTPARNSRQSVAQAPAGPPMQIAPGEPPAKKPEAAGVLERIGSYARSPTRIANAVTDGVSKLASYIPGL